MAIQFNTFTASLLAPSIESVQNHYGPLREGYPAPPAIQHRNPVLPCQGEPIKTAQVIPDDELWLHAPETKASVDRALAWSESHPRAASDLAVVAKRVKREK